MTGKQRLCIYGLRVCWWSSIVTKLLACCFHQNRSCGVAVSMHCMMQKPILYLWLWLLREWISRVGMPAALHNSAYSWVSLAVVKKTRTCKAMLLSQFCGYACLDNVQTSNMCGLLLTFLSTQMLSCSWTGLAKDALQVQSGNIGSA